MLCHVFIALRAPAQEPSNEVNYVFGPGCSISGPAGGLQCLLLPHPPDGLIAIPLVVVGLHLMSSVAPCIEMLSGVQLHVQELTPF